MTTIDEVRELIHRSWNTPDGPGRILLAEQALARAEALADPDVTYAANVAATSAYHQGGEPTKAMVTFARCLADYDADPGRRSDNDERLLLWHFKYVVSAMARFPEVPLNRTMAVLDDMQRRYQAGGHSLHAVYAYRHNVASHIGDLEQADHWYRLWEAAPRDRNSDCAGCDPTSKAYHLAWRGRDEEAITVAQDALNGRLNCAEQPQGILTALLLPYLRTGRLDAARDAHRRAYRALCDSRANLEGVSRHIEFCGLTGNEIRGLELIERHLPWLEQSPTPKAEMEFAAAAVLVLNRLSEAGQGDLAVRQRGGEVSVAELRDSLRERAVAIANRFDARNGNTFQSERMSDRMNAKPLVDYLPLSVTAAHRRRQQVAPPAPPAADITTVPADRPLDEQLDLVDEWFQQEDEPRAKALARRLLTQFADEPLSELQRGRLAKLEALLADQRDLATAAAAFETAVAAFERSGDRERELATRVQWETVRLQMTGEKKHAQGAQAAADQLLQLSGDPVVRRNALVRVAYVAAMVGEPDRALELLDRAQAEPGPVPVARQARITYLRAKIFQAQGRTGEALAELRATAERLRPLQRGDLLGGVLMSLAELLGALGEHAAAVATFEEAAAVAEDAELRRSARANAGFMLVTTDRAGEFIDDIVEHVCLMEAAGEPAPAAYTRHRLALALATTGRFAEAAEVAEEALAWFVKQADDGYQDMVIELRDVLARIYTALDEREVALGQLDALLEQVTGVEQLAYRADVLERAGELLWQLDRDEEAAQRFAAAAQAYGQADLPLATVRTRRRYALALHHAGRQDEALAAVTHLEELIAVTEVPPEQQAELTWECATAGYEAAQVLTNSDTPDYSRALARIAPVAARYRSIEAFHEAALADLRHGQVLLLAGEAAAAESLLRRLLDELPTDHGARREAAAWLARALDELGEQQQAQALRKEYDLPFPD